MSKRMSANFMMPLAGSRSAKVFIKMPNMKTCGLFPANIFTNAICGSIGICRHSGKYLLDAGSGPIQYPEYLTYSEGYQYRVCLDISIVALIDARERIGDHGLFVVADIAHLPFKNDAFDDVVSLHTIHHLPPEEYQPAYFELKRVLKPGATAVVVNGWSDSAIMRFFRLPMRFMEKLFHNR